MPVANVVDSYGGAPINGFITDFHSIESVGQSDIDGEFPTLRVWNEDSDSGDTDYVETDTCFIEEAYAGTKEPKTITVHVADSCQDDDLNSATEYEKVRYAKRVITEQGSGVVVAQNDDVRPPERLIHREGEIVGIYPN